ncbi:hypothetical protein NL676_021743 [Syzygium grande]|nr:hypothetical protein NL676_021743 [Syzygium grande]
MATLRHVYMDAYTHKWLVFRANIEGTQSYSRHQGLLPLTIIGNVVLLTDVTAAVKIFRRYQSEHRQKATIGKAFDANRVFDRIPKPSPKVHNLIEFRFVDPNPLFVEVPVRNLPVLDRNLGFGNRSPPPRWNGIAWNSILLRASPFLTEPRGDPRGAPVHKSSSRRLLPPPPPPPPSSLLIYCPAALNQTLSLSLSATTILLGRFCRSSPPIHRALRIPLPPLALSSARDPRRSFRRPYATRAGRGEAKVDGGAPVGGRQLNRARSRAVVVAGRAGGRAFAAADGVVVPGWGSALGCF